MRRGASHDTPENTVAAAKLAWEQEADATELDVHLSKDGKIVVIHDEDTERVAGRMVELGVDGITTDRPGWLRDQLDQ